MKRIFWVLMIMFLCGCTAHKHDYKVSVIEPKCLSGGYTEYVCSCGEKYRDNYTNALGHIYGEEILLEESTCNQQGKKKKQCINCGNVITLSIPRLDCNFTLRVVKEPTFDEEGLIDDLCEHGLSDGTIVLPAYSSGKYDSSVIVKPLNKEVGIREHKINVNKQEYVFYEEFTGIDDDQLVYDYVGIDVILEKRGTFVGGDLIIPEGVTIINSNVFSGLNINKVILPSTLKTIEYSAFNECHIESIYIPESINYINPNSFRESIINKIEVDEKNGMYYSVENSLVNKENKELILGGSFVPDGVKIIGSYAFSRSNIESIIIPEGVEEIKNNAFADCLNLKEVVIPSTVKVLGYDFQNYNVFIGCSSLEKISISENNDVFKSINNSIVEIKTGKLITASISTNNTDGVKIIGDSSFMGLDNSFVIISSSVVEIESNAFIESGIETLFIPEGLKTIGMSAFTSCKNLKYIYISSTVENIIDNVFNYCSNLEEIVVSPDNQYYKSVNNSIIEKSTNTLITASNTTIIENVSVIGSHAFAGLNIKSIDIPNTVYEIENNAFFDCEYLEDVTLSSNVKTIDFGVFAGCENLTSINLSHVEYFCDTAFNMCKKLSILNLASVKEIDEYAFANMNIELLCLPKSLEVIDKKAFWGSKVMKIELDKENQYYEIVDNSLIDSNAKEVIIEVSYGI